MHLPGSDHMGVKLRRGIGDAVEEVGRWCGRQNEEAVGAGNPPGLNI